jgi:hypothetical protein
LFLFYFILLIIFGGWRGRQRATLYGGLLTTIQTLAKQSLAMHPSYIEYGQGICFVVLVVALRATRGGMCG